MLVIRVMEKLEESWGGGVERRELSRVNECVCTVNVKDECLCFI